MFPSLVRLLCGVWRLLMYAYMRLCLCKCDDGILIEFEDNFVMKALIIFVRDALAIDSVVDVKYITVKRIIVED